MTATEPIVAGSSGEDAVVAEEDRAGRRRTSVQGSVFWPVERFFGFVTEPVERAGALQHEEEVVDQRIDSRLLHLSRLHGRVERLAVEPSRPRHLERHLGRR